MVSRAPTLSYRSVETLSALEAELSTLAFHLLKEGALLICELTSVASETICFDLSL